MIYSDQALSGVKIPFASFIDNRTIRNQRTGQVINKQFDDKTQTLQKGTEVRLYQTKLEYVQKTQSWGFALKRSYNNAKVRDQNAENERVNLAIPLKKQTFLPHGHAPTQKFKQPPRLAFP